MGCLELLLLLLLESRLVVLLLLESRLRGSRTAFCLSRSVGSAQIARSVRQASCSLPASCSSLQTLS